MANTTVSQLQFENTGELLDIKPLVDYIYPVGAIYFSSSLVNPALLFSGTWEQIKDAFLLCAGDTYAAGTTGGSATMTHTHSQVAVTTGGPSNNTSGANNNATAGPSNNTSGGPSTGSTGGPSNNSTSSVGLSVAQMPSHNHGSAGGQQALIRTDYNRSAIMSGWLGAGDANTGFAYSGFSVNGNRAYTMYADVGAHTHSSNGSGSGHSHTLNSHTHSMQSHTHSLQSHTHTMSSHTHTLSSHTHSISATTTGGASNTNNMPPYVTIYAWKRTA